MEDIPSIQVTAAEPLRTSRESDHSASDVEHLASESSNKEPLRDSEFRMKVKKSEQVRRATAVLGAKVMNEDLIPDRPLKVFVKKRLDSFMGIVVAVNITMMASRHASKHAIEVHRWIWNIT